MFSRHGWSKFGRRAHPRLNEALDRLVESPAAFERRRVDGAMQKLIAAGLPLDEWRIAYLAHPRQVDQDASE
jgi:hypothetical protein